jgi:undecaprenyl-diphosphatase
MKVQAKTVEAKSVQAKTVQAKTVGVGPPGTSVASREPIDRRRVALLLLTSYVLLVGAGTGIGLLLRGPLEDTALVRMDQRVAVWFAEQRTPDLNRYTVWGSDLADTFIKIAATAVLALVLYLLWRRWRDPLVVILSLVLEASVFISVTSTP